MYYLLSQKLVLLICLLVHTPDAVYWLLSLTKGCFCSALDISIGRFISEAENALVTNSTLEYPEVETLYIFR